MAWDNAVTAQPFVLWLVASCLTTNPLRRSLITCQQPRTFHSTRSPPAPTTSTPPLERRLRGPPHGHRDRPRQLRRVPGHDRRHRRRARARRAPSRSPASTPATRTATATSRRPSSSTPSSTRRSASTPPPASRRRRPDHARPARSRSRASPSRSSSPARSPRTARTRGATSASASSSRADRPPRLRPQVEPDPAQRQPARRQRGQAAGQRLRGQGGVARCGSWQSPAACAQRRTTRRCCGRPPSSPPRASTSSSIEGLERLPPYNEDRDTDDPPAEVAASARGDREPPTRSCSPPRSTTARMPGQLKQSSTGPRARTARAPRCGASPWR